MFHAKVKLVTLFSLHNEKNVSALAGVSPLGLFFALFIRVEFRRLFPVTRMR